MRESHVHLIAKKNTGGILCVTLFLKVCRYSASICFVIHLVVEVSWAMFLRLL